MVCVIKFYIRTLTDIHVSKTNLDNRINPHNEIPSRTNAQYNKYNKSDILSSYMYYIICNN